MVLIDIFLVAFGLLLAFVGFAEMMGDETGQSGWMGWALPFGIVVAVGAILHLVMTLLRA